MSKNRFDVDYYITERSNKGEEYDEYNIVDKMKFSVLSSSGTVGENFDIFIKKIYFRDNKEPKSKDLVFFQDPLKFFQVVESQESGDYYIVNINKYKIKQ